MEMSNSTAALEECKIFALTLRALRMHLPKRIFSPQKETKWQMDGDNLDGDARELKMNVR
jgi:hypothetical protein